MDVYRAFNRRLMALVHADVRRIAKVKAPMRAASVHRVMRDQWEFHGPDRFYWHGRADDAYHARASGWQAYLRKHHPNEE